MIQSPHSKLTIEVQTSYPIKNDKKDKNWKIIEVINSNLFIDFSQKYFL